MAVFDQVFEEIEYLRGDGNQLRPATQLATVRIEHKVCEAIEQITWSPAKNAVRCPS
jgi:hypothetical protein